MMNRKNNYASGFSLAEAMVMLVVVSIIMAVSAPLIAHKATADQNRIVILDGGNVRSAQGGAQNFILGAGVPDANTKLQVNGNAVVHSPVAGDIANADNTQVFSVAPGANAANQRGFKVFANGTTNVRTCVPDYNHPGGVVSPATADGYIVSSRCLTVAGNRYCPSSTVTNISLAEGALTSVTSTFQGVVVVPVAKDDAIGAQEELTNAGTYRTAQSGANVYRFIPCQRESIR